MNNTESQERTQNRRILKTRTDYAAQNNKTAMTDNIILPLLHLLLNTTTATITTTSNNSDRHIPCE